MIYHLGMDKNKNLSVKSEHDLWELLRKLKSIDGSLQIFSYTYNEVNGNIDHIIVHLRGSHFVPQLKMAGLEELYSRTHKGYRTLSMVFRIAS